MKKRKIKWLDLPEEHDYPAAESYLNLIFNDKISKDLVELLKESEMTQFKGKDIFRASRLPLLGMNNTHVRKNMKKIKRGEKISPLLLVRDLNGGVIIADGYHRLVSTYIFSEDIWIPCKIVSSL